LLGDSVDGLFAKLPGASSTVVLHDLDGDEQPEIVVAVGGVLGGVADQTLAFRPDGSMLPGYPLSFGEGINPFPTTPLVGDINHDGLADMLTVQFTSTSVTVWELGFPVRPGQSRWSKVMGDLWNSNVAVTPRYDLVHLILILDAAFSRGEPIPPYEPSDLNCDGALNVGDVVRLIDYLYRGGGAPCLM